MANRRDTPERIEPRVTPSGVKSPSPASRSARWDRAEPLRGGYEPNGRPSPFIEGRPIKPPHLIAPTDDDFVGQPANTE
jgi:hypothetical protein